MPKTDVHVKLDPALIAALKRYAAGNGISFTAALSLSAARLLAAEGITIQGEDNDR